MTKTAVILAGGFGTRLQSVLPDLPKPMAPVAGKPFLEYLFQQCKKSGIEKIILSVGYKHEAIKNYFGNEFECISVQYSIEENPLGTGGAILKASELVDEENFFVLNGDSFFATDLGEISFFHETEKPDISLALKMMFNFERYGSVVRNDDCRIVSFHEKKFVEQGEINAGVYVVNKKFLQSLSLPEKFSFEKDVLEKYVSEKKFCGISFMNYFIDIGIPEDYEIAQHELPKELLPYGERMKDELKLFTVFLDRDGVLNKKIDNDYVKTWNDFEWLSGAKEALKILATYYGRIIVVTNQQGVGKGLMTESDLNSIHEKMTAEAQEAGGRIDKIYFAPQLATENSPMRKPNTGMALQAQKDFPEIDFTTSIMIGDSKIDMQLGEALGMMNIFISNSVNEAPKDMTCYTYASLFDFANTLLK